METTITSMSTTTTTASPTEKSTVLIMGPDTDLRDGDWVIVLLILAAIGILLVVAFEIYLLYKMTGKFIRSMWLGQMLLFGLFLSFLSLFAFAPTPTNTSCGIIRFSVGFCYAIIYSVFLVKLMILFSSKTIGYLKGIFQILMFIFALGVQLAIDVEWLILKPPEAVLTSTYDGDGNTKVMWVCSHSFSSHVTTLSYIMFLIVVCAILAFKSVNIVTNYRESLFIAVCSFMSILIFLAWILLGMLHENKEFEDPCLAFGLLITAMLVLLIMFSPKVHQLKKMNQGEPFIDYDYDDDRMGGEYNTGTIASNTIHIDTITEPNGMVYAPPNYKTNSVSPPALYVDDIDASAIYSEAYNKPHHLHVETHPEALYLKHPGQRDIVTTTNPTGSIGRRSIAGSYSSRVKNVGDIYATNPRVMKVNSELAGRHHQSMTTTTSTVGRTQSEVNGPSLRVYQPGHGTARSVISTRSARSGAGTLSRARSLQDLGAL